MREIPLVCCVAWLMNELTESMRAIVAYDYVLPILLDLDGPAWAAFRNSVVYGHPEEPRTKGGPRLYIIQSGFFSEDLYGQQKSLPTSPLVRFRGEPLLFGNNRLETRGCDYILHADMVASSFFLVTRYEEWVTPGGRDAFGRFCARPSIGWREGFLRYPLVERYGRILRQVFAEAKIEVPAPQDRAFNVVLTHDLDNPRQNRGWRTALGETRRLIAGRSTVRRWRTAWGGALGLVPDPYNTFPQIFALSKAAREHFAPGRLRDIHFIMSGGTSPYDRRYSLKDPYVRSILEAIGKSGAEFGLHVSFEAGERGELLPGERQALENAIGRSVTCSRHHYLRFVNISDVSKLAGIGITDDYTMSYPDCLGFRLGVTRPISAFDPITFSAVTLRYHPTTVMDATLDGGDYMGLGEDEAFNEVERHAKEISSSNGELVLLWHNCRLTKNSPSYHSRLYPRIIRSLPRWAALAG